MSNRSAKTLGGTIIDTNAVISLIDNMLRRNTIRFNNKLNDFIKARIKEIEKNKEDAFYNFLYSKIKIIDSINDFILIKNLSILYYITIIEFNKEFYEIYDDTILLYPMDKIFYYSKTNNIYIKTDHGVKIIRGYKNAIELLNDEELLKDNHDLILELKNILIDGMLIVLDVKDLLRINKDTFITLPQYGPICWFISILTCITYSDRNKKLLLTKKSINEKNITTMSDIKEHQYEEI
jgi:hypothetical protein